jgi:AraC-like DNA-binding protein
MRPEVVHSLQAQHELSALMTALSASQVYLTSATPGGSIRVLIAAEGGTTLNRSFMTYGASADLASWTCITDRKPFATSSPGRPAETQTMRQWLGRIGMQHAIAAPICSPYLAGYHGAIVACRGIGQPDFEPSHRQQLADGAGRFDEASRQRFGVLAEANRFFVFGSSGRSVGLSPQHADMASETLNSVRELVEKWAKDPNAAADQRTDRFSLPGHQGELLAFRAVTQLEHPSLGGSALVVCRVPESDEWLRVRAEDVPCDTEFGRLLPAVQFMNEQFGQGVILPAIAKAVHLSPFHFHRRFTEQLGITPKHLLYDLQIARAKGLLEANTMELDQVARVCGFAHQSHFTSRFRQSTGLTPTKWRRLRRSESNPAAGRPSVSVSITPPAKMSGRA